MDNNLFYVVDSKFSNTAALVLKQAKYYCEPGVLKENIHRPEGQIIGYRNGCLIGIQKDDIQDPHFFLAVGGYIIAFDIMTGKRMAGETGYEKLDKFIEIYWELDRIQIADKWNQIRHEDRFKMPSNWTQDLTDPHEVTQGIERLHSAKIPKNDGKNNAP